jgi:16S rRNA (guanine(1405)-N(7))-methyltransferase
MRRPLEPGEIAQGVLAARKYSAILPDLVFAVSAVETPKAEKAQEALKRVKTKLHQMVGAYLDVEMPFAEWLEELTVAAPDERSAVCLKILRHHASTRERMAETQEFFAAVFEGVPPPTTVADLACGLNPLARSLMPLSPKAMYIACDVHLGILSFVDAALRLMNFPIQVSPLNLISNEPLPSADVALLLKTIPCLEQMDKQAGVRLLSRIDAPLVIVTYPTAGLSGSRHGMARFYEKRFLEMVPKARFEIEKRHFDSELMFRLFRRSSEEEGGVLRNE